MDGKATVCCTAQRNLRNECLSASACKFVRSFARVYFLHEASMHMSISMRSSRKVSKARLGRETQDSRMKTRRSRTNPIEFSKSNAELRVTCV